MKLLIFLALMFSVFQTGYFQSFSVGAKWHVGWSAPIYLPEYQLFLCTNPKCACTTLRKMCLELVGITKIRGQKTLHDSIFARMDPRIPVDRLFVIRNDTEAVSVFNDKKVIKASFVRHPLSRFISGYLNRIIADDVNKIPKNMLLVGFRKFLFQLHRFVDQYRKESMMSQIFGKVDQISSYSAIPPEFPQKTLKEMTRIPRMAEKRIKKIISLFPNTTTHVKSHALDYIDEHFQLISARCGHRYYDYDVIGKIESFDEDLTSMFQLMDRDDLALRFLSSSSSSSKSSPVPKIANPSDVDLTDWLTNELTDLDRRLVKALYHEDYDLFNYH